MANVCLILGESGVGKSASLRNMPASDTLVIQAVKKPMPFKAAEWGFLSKENPKGNIIVTHDKGAVLSALGRTSRNVIVLDDWSYATSLPTLSIGDRKGDGVFQVYRDIAADLVQIIEAAAALPDSKRVYIMAHVTTDETSGTTHMKTAGKLLSNTITVEGLVTMVLRARKANGRHFFQTTNDGSDTTKTPIGMFSEEHIDNDLALVDKAVCAYYEIGGAV